MKVPSKRESPPPGLLHHHHVLPPIVSTTSAPLPPGASCYSIPYSPTTGFDFTPTLLHPRRRRRAAPRLVLHLLPLSLFFFVSASLFTCSSLACYRVPAVLCRFTSLPPTCSSRRLLHHPSPNWVAYRWAVTRTPAHTRSHLSLDRDYLLLRTTSHACPRQLASIPSSSPLPLPPPTTAGADADRCERPSTSVGYSAPRTHSQLISLEFGGGLEHLDDVPDCFSSWRRATTTRCWANLVMATNPATIPAPTCLRIPIQAGRTVDTGRGRPTAAIALGRPPLHRALLILLPPDGLRISRPAKVVSGTGREGEEEDLPAVRRGPARRAVSP